ncbi:hypothetical protein B0T19DRAFT_271023 [Cercophora scortea]|uniref:Uncharacterized protein n=1 Tax=Cercophora scortea TaxID=314031 RepID=A0AAE0I7J0_9PEZI|nr:hypothetical protein B0T19DRAFT_271023 [Cercophora scortea]
MAIISTDYRRLMTTPSIPTQFPLASPFAPQLQPPPPPSPSPKMLNKRKRSDSELSSFSASGSSANFMDIDGRSPFSPPRASAHVSSRTMKRFRNNRPSESQVHQHTLSLLFSAQPNNHTTAPQLAQPVTATPQQPHNQIPQQRSLHSFWKIPVSASSSATPSPALTPLGPPQSRSTSCEDCGAGLVGDDDSMMDIDGYGFAGTAAGAEDEHSCRACGKAVCFSCSVSNMGENRRCLACAEPRGPVAAGWSRGVGVF